MILVDTSVWVDHLRVGDRVLQQLLDRAQVLCHPFVIGEIALGHVRARATILSSLHQLPAAKIARDGEVLQLIESNALFGTGLGYVDAHLITAVRLTPGSTIWTRDGMLHALASRLGLAASPRRLAAP